MPYNRKNKLLFIRDVIDVYEREKKPGISTAYVYREFIFPRFRIGRTTLYNYLSTPVNRLLKEEDAKCKNG